MAAPALMMLALGVGATFAIMSSQNATVKKKHAANQPTGEEAWKLFEEVAGVVTSTTDPAVLEAEAAKYEARGDQLGSLVASMLRARARQLRGEEPQPQPQPGTSDPVPKTVRDAAIVAVDRAETACPGEGAAIAAAANAFLTVAPVSPELAYTTLLRTLEAICPALAATDPVTPGGGSGGGGGGGGGATGTPPSYGPPPPATPPGTAEATTADLAREIARVEQTNGCANIPEELIREFQAKALADGLLVVGIFRSGYYDIATSMAAVRVIGQDAAAPCYYPRPGVPGDFDVKLDQFDTGFEQMTT